MSPQLVISPFTSNLTIPSLLEEVDTLLNRSTLNSHKLCHWGTLLTCNFIDYRRGVTKSPISTPWRWHDPVSSSLGSVAPLRPSLPLFGPSFAKDPVKKIFLRASANFIHHFHSFRDDNETMSPSTTIYCHDHVSTIGVWAPMCEICSVSFREHLKKSLLPVDIAYTSTVFTYQPTVTLPTVTSFITFLHLSTIWDTQGPRRPLYLPIVSSLNHLTHQ